MLVNTHSLEWHWWDGTLLFVLHSLIVIFFFPRQVFIYKYLLNLWLRKSSQWKVLTLREGFFVLLVAVSGTPGGNMGEIFEIMKTSWGKTTLGASVSSQHVSIPPVLFVCLFFIGHVGNLGGVVTEFVSRTCCLYPGEDIRPPPLVWQRYWLCFIFSTLVTGSSFPPTARCLLSSQETPQWPVSGRVVHAVMCTGFGPEAAEVLSILWNKGGDNYASLVRRNAREKELNERHSRTGRDLNGVRKNPDEPCFRRAKLLHKLHKMLNKSLSPV